MRLSGVSVSITVRAHDELIVFAQIAAGDWVHGLARVVEGDRLDALASPVIHDGLSTE